MYRLSVELDDNVTMAMTSTAIAETLDLIEHTLKKMASDQLSMNTIEIAIRRPKVVNTYTTKIGGEHGTTDN